MVGSARTAMRNPVFTQLPKMKPLWWVMINKARATLGAPIPFDRYVNYERAKTYSAGPARLLHIEMGSIRRQLHDEKDGHYDAFGAFSNR